MKVSIRHIIYTPLLLLFTVSCIKKDFKQVSTDVTFNPTYSLPIGRVTNTIYDFIPESEFICNIDTALINDSIRLIETDGCYIPLPGYTFQHETFKTFDFSTLEEELQNAKMIMFVINYKSGFPCQAHVTANFNSTRDNTLFTLFDPELLISPGEDDQTIVELTGEEIDQLPDVRYIQIITTIDISELNQKVIVFDPEDTIDVQIGLKAELEISTDNLL
jgi:hypothetical protein